MFPIALKGAKAIVDQASSVKNYLKSSADQLAAQTPEPSQALDALKSFATSYAAFIPGGRAFVDSSFKDLDAVRAKHGDAVDKIVKDTYAQMQSLVKKDGLSLDGAAKAYDVLTTQMKKIGDLAADAAGDLIDRHPEIKEKLGGSVDQLRTYAEKYGPDAKKRVDETWAQVSEVLKNGKGLSKENIDNVRKIVQDAAASIEELGNEAFKKGIEQAQPMLDKVPQVKELINKNMNDLMKKADWQELYQKIQEAVKNGKTQPVEEYVKKVLEATKDK